VLRSTGTRTVSPSPRVDPCQRDTVPWLPISTPVSLHTGGGERQHPLVSRHHMANRQNRCPRALPRFAQRYLEDSAAAQRTARPPTRDKRGGWWSPLVRCNKTSRPRPGTGAPPAASGVRFSRILPPHSPLSHSLRPHTCPKVAPTPVPRPAPPHNRLRACFDRQPRPSLLFASVLM